MSSRLHEPIRGSGEVGQQVVSTSQKFENDGCRQIDNIREAQILTTKSKEIDSEIVKTKKENLTLYQSANTGSVISRVPNELSAIDTGTEDATESILCSAEIIDQLSADLVAFLKLESENSMASDIQDQVIKIIEACHFQDLTGQRVSKVVKAFSLVEL